MKLFAISAVLLLTGAAHADGVCAAGFTQTESRTSTIYTCKGPALSCRKGWFVAEVNSGEASLSGYLCQASAEAYRSAIGVSPAVCPAGFHPDPPAVHDGEAYECQTARSRIVPLCPPGYAAGTIMLGDTTLLHAQSKIAALMRHYDGAAVSYECKKP
jgi:hypothetical protein